MDNPSTAYPELRHLLKDAPGFMAMLVGPAHEFVMTNDAYLQLVGHRDLVGLPVREALPDIEGQGFYELLDEVYSTGEPFIGKDVEITLQPEADGPIRSGVVNFVYQPMTDAAGKVTGIFVEGHDVTAEKRAEEAAELARLKVQLALEAAEIGIWEAVARDGKPVAFSGDARAERMLGRAAADDAETFFSVMHEGRDGLVSDLTALLTAPGEGVLDAEIELRADEDGLSRWLHLRAQAVRSGSTIRLLGTLRDMTDQKEAETRQTMLRNELAHRIKNTLAVVSAIAGQTFKGPDRAEQRATFGGRIAALSAAQDVLMDETGAQRSMADLVRTTVAPHATMETVRIDGPLVMLGPRQTVSFALAVHELATNSVKYGALSNGTGAVDVAWTVGRDGDGREALRWHWAETGGPELGGVSKTGFGSKLIKHALAREIGGSVEMDFRREGVRCGVVAPLDSLG